MVNILWSLTAGGGVISGVLDHGDSQNGHQTTERTIYVRHDGTQKITGVGLYIRQFSGTYSGSFTAAADIAEILGWGDGENPLGNDFGGFQYNFTGLVGDWPTVSNKDPGSKANGATHRNGVGDSEAHAIDLPTTTGADTATEIQNGETDVHFKVRMAVPSTEDTVGIRQWDSILRYNFTS